MSVDDRFEELAESLGGFYRTWLTYLGIELGLFRELRAHGPAGLTPAELAEATGTDSAAVDAWVHGADAGDLVAFDGERVRVDDDVAAVLLDDDRPEFLGGQFVATVVSSMDHDRLAGFFRSGAVMAERPPRFHRAIESVTVQDIAVFFQEALAALPELAADLARGQRVLDVACGAGRWLIAVAKRFPHTSLVGVEFEPTSVRRAAEAVAVERLEDRIRIVPHDVAELPFEEDFDLVYFQDALHELPDPVASLRAAWAAIRPGGRLVVLDWTLPATLEESRTLQGILLWGIQLDELFQGTRMYTRQGFESLFADAGLPAPAVVELPSGASVFVARRD
jgi:SAM-dependent methyltransferase